MLAFAAAHWDMVQDQGALVVSACIHQTCIHAILRKEHLEVHA